MDRENLPWLLPAPATAGSQLRNLPADPRERMAALLDLASHALDTNQLHSLRRALRATPDVPIDGVLPVGIRLLSNATGKLIAPCLEATGLRYRLRATIVEGGHDQVLQEALQPSFPLAADEVVLLALDHRGIPGLASEFEAREDDAVEGAFGFLRSVRDGLKRAGAGAILFQTVAQPPDALFGSADLTIAGSRRRRIQAFNHRLAEAVTGWQDLLVDVAALAEQVGVDRWFNEVEWHLAKLPFAQRFAPLYADQCVRVVAAARGRIRKCLVLDLDNTLWGGVIGDDLLEGIVVGQGTATGEAFLAVQRMALTLRARGILLAVCSKNDEAAARAPFRAHPDMLVREEHLSAFVANWEDKATNVERIACQLNIGLDAVVFVDDSPVEREQVRRQLPMVAVPEVPADPALVPWYISAAGYFETTTLVADDLTRADRYQQNAARAADAGIHHNLDEFLASLQTELTFAPFDPIGRPRIVQLILRSNQFNLTTRRYSEDEVERWERAADAFTLQVRLSDRFGDNGMISVVICRTASESWTIDTWLMSCRVLNRRVQEAVLDEIVEQARRAGAITLVGLYRPTDRNGLVRDHYRSLGFACAGQNGDQEEWVLDLNACEMRRPPMLVTRTADASTS